MNKGKGKGNGVLLLILTAMIIISLSGTLKRYTTELFTLLGLRENYTVYTVDNLKADLASLKSQISDNTGETSEFKTDSKAAIKNAKDLIFRTKKFRINQEKLQRAFLHKIYRNIGIVILLFIILYLVVKNKKYIADIFKNIISFVKGVVDSSKNIQELRDQVGTMRNVLGINK